MEELCYKPRPVNHRASFTVLGLMIPAILLFLISMWVPAYGGLLQILSLGLIVGGLFVSYKFICILFISR